jgi:hypothetical protein
LAQDHLTQLGITIEIQLEMHIILKYTGA